MGVLVYGVEAGFFLWGCLWVFRWLHRVGIGVGDFGELSLEP